jgi:hypothetical protein
MLEPSGVGRAARLQRVEAGSADQTLDRRRGGVVIGGVVISGVEEHGSPWFAVCPFGVRFRTERANCLHVVRARGKQGNLAAFRAADSGIFDLVGEKPEGLVGPDPVDRLPVLFDEPVLEAEEVEGREVR